MPNCLLPAWKPSSLFQVMVVVVPPSILRFPDVIVVDFHGVSVSLSNGNRRVYRPGLVYANPPRAQFQRIFNAFRLEKLPREPNAHNYLILFWYLGKI